ncbi:hypothetical protein DRQ09_05880 [candidate division KSB1 bacterium]|nr:MAG: hypothetical protein DRQ09_05880 [candidate division KSB1 bacterium]
MVLFLVRHGETNWNLQNRVQGVSDIPLNERGKVQVLNLAESLKNENIKIVYTSHLKRALQTARIISKILSVEIRIEKNLMELNQGEIEGLTYSELHRKYPELVKLWRKDPVKAKMPGGEDIKQLQNRAWKTIKKIAKIHQKDKVVVVSHNLTIRSLLCKFLNLNLKYFRRIHLDTASKNTIEFYKSDGDTGDGILVKCINDTSFLPRNFNQSIEGI